MKAIVKVTGLYLRITALRDDPSRIGISEGRAVTVLHRLADQDGWNGEMECVTQLGQHVAIPEENLEPNLL